MEHTYTPGMRWYHYISGFFAGFFLANAIPHLFNGISGDAFPTPFADDPGVGLSSPLTNVLWALGNLLIGYLLFRIGRVNSRRPGALFTFFIGAATISIALSILFTDKAFAY